MDVADQQQHYIVASDGAALFAANSFAFDLPKSVIVPDSKFLNWTELMDDGCRLAVEPPAKGASQGFIRLASDRWTFITRELDAQFPRWTQSVPAMTSPKTVIKLSAPAVKQLLEVLPQLPGQAGIHRIVRLKLESGQFKLEGRNEQGGWTGVFIQNTTITGQPVTIGLNRDYLVTALKFNLDEIQIENPLKPLVCVNGGKKLVIMPVKLEDPPTTRPVPAPQTPTTKAPDAKPADERKTEMPETTKPQPADADGTGDALDHVETIKGHLREALGGLTRLTGLLKQVEKDKRSTEKEVASVRQTLRSLQGLKL